MVAKNSIGGWLGTLLCVLALVPQPVPAQDVATKEYQIKAAFLFNFAQFVDWPPDVLTNVAEPFCIGILGDDPFGAALAETVRGETIRNHKIILEHAERIGDLKNCQLIFVSKSEKGHVGEIFSQLDSRPVLTVSDLDDFARRGGIINFYREGTKLRFEINAVAAQRDGLKISSQLLSLGKIVQPDSGKEEK